MLIENGRIITPDGVLAPGWLQIEGGRIAGLGLGPAPTEAGERRDAGGDWLAPGFIDVHVHGSAGYDTMDADPAVLRILSRFFARHGVTGFLATTWTDSHARILAAMQAVRMAMDEGVDGATLLGAHMEGPYLNPAYCGAQNPAHIRRADRTEIAELFSLDVIRRLSLAPEYEENHWLISECVARGIGVCAAHTGATYEQMQAAIGLGLGHATHTYNAMTGLHHRRPGVVGAVLTSSAILAEIIADAVHVHPVAVDVLWRAKGTAGVALITDAIRAGGMPDGDYVVDERIMTVRDGVCTLEDGTLAGSVATMDAAVRGFLHATGQPLETVWQVASLNPARALNIDERTGSIDVGKDADLVLLDSDLRVRLTIVRGRVVYDREVHDVTAES